jgi:galactose mutarotase-like enzyme
MHSIAKVAKNGTVLSWEVNGVALIYPEQVVDTEQRGGIPLCAPMFSVQQRPVNGCHLPLHGLLMYEETGETTELTAGDTWTSTLTFPASDAFAWDFSVHLKVILGERALSQELIVLRSPTCTNTQEMPLSLGLHPYFSTFGKDFSYNVSGTTITKQQVGEDIINSDFASIGPAILQTIAGTITILPTGYDEYCLWTDDIDKYFCIEPIYQYREFGLSGTGLQPGEKTEVGCRIEFTPK